MKEEQSGSCGSCKRLVLHLGVGVVMFGRLFSKSRRPSEPGVESDSSPQEKVWFENCKFSDFKLGPILGTGSFGRVHLAHHTPTGQVCATKSLSKASIVKTKQVVHVKQEKDILARISHPFVVNLLGYCQDDQCVHLIIEYVCGGEFFTYLRSTGRFDEHTTKFYASQVLCAFEYLHDMDIIYRDLKPENLLLDEKGNIKVTDFGFAKEIDRRTYTLCGNALFIVTYYPALKYKILSRWTFGVLIYEMLAGYPPFYDDDAVGTYQKILSGKVNFPGHFSRRLGCLKGGVKDIKTHDWFKAIDWDSVVYKKETPPIRPKVSSKDDTSCFDDYSKLGPMKHEFVLTADDQLLFRDL